jgi:hypothetical protein
MKYIWLCVVCLLLQSCASILYIKGEEPIVALGKEGKSACVGDVKILLVSQSFGTTHSFPLETGREDAAKKQYQLVLSKINELRESGKGCSSDIKTVIEIRNMPVDEKRALALLNIITIGIIPYFDEYTNSVVIKNYSKNGDFLGESSSSVNYEMIHSIFLWPAMPFYISGTDSLNLKTLPRHFDNIKNVKEKNDLK